MQNPIPHNAFFYTPETLGELQDRIETLNPKDKALVYTFVTQAMNVCHNLVEQQHVAEGV
jgi:hypothetical protein